MKKPGKRKKPKKATPPAVVFVPQYLIANWNILGN
jgi:hypothetical protein